MNIKKALDEYPTIMDQVRGLRESIETMRATRHDTKITAGISGMPGGGGISNPTMDQVMEIDDRIGCAVKEALEDIADLLELKAMVEARLKRLGIQERRVIELKYFDKIRQWADIGKKLNYSKVHCQRLHKAAIDILEKDDTK